MGNLFVCCYTHRDSLRPKSVFDDIEDAPQKSPSLSEVVTNPIIYCT